MTNKRDQVICFMSFKDVILGIKRTGLGRRGGGGSSCSLLEQLNWNY